MAKWRTLVGAVALLFFTAAALAQGERYPRLSGVWQGSYSYKEGSGQKDVPFEIHLAQRGQSLSGRIIEPNTFGHPSAPKLFANLVGIIDGRRLRLVKTYDGTGGQNHSAYYEGELNSDATAVSGVWIIENGWRGGFRAKRESQGRN